MRALRRSNACVIDGSRRPSRIADLLPLHPVGSRVRLKTGRQEYRVEEVWFSAGSGQWFYHGRYGAMKFYQTEDKIERA